MEPEEYLTYDDAAQFIRGLDAMAVLDKDGRYIYVSPAWSKMRGISVEEARKHYVWDLLPDTHARITLRTGKPVFAQPVQVRGRNAFTSYFPRYAPDGSLNGCYLYVIINGMEDAQSVSQRITDLSSKLQFYQKELSRERGARYTLDNIIGESAPIVQLRAQIAQAARSSSTVLIEGETGSGKELIAHAIHSLSPRSPANFVRVNCSAIPEELMEAEFFGYTSGAFTGAIKGGKTGRFELADKGSIFLDEVNLLSTTMQPKFLRVLQEHEINPVGSGKSVPIDVRVIAATNIPLEQLVEEGKFRSDLYFRLNVIRIIAPPLRSRKSDIPLLTDSLIERLNNQLGMAVQGISPEALDLLMKYDWPGNVRELQNAIESAMNMTHSTVLQRRDFERLINRIGARRAQALPSGENQLRPSKQAFERTLVQEALENCGGNRAQAARQLGISRTVLYKKLEKYGLK